MIHYDSATLVLKLFCWNYWKICDNIWYIFTMSYDVPFQCCLGPTQWVYFQPRSFEKTVHCAGCRTPSSTRMHWKPNNHCFLGIWHHRWATSQLSHVGHVFCKFHLYPFVMYQFPDSILRNTNDHTASQPEVTPLLKGDMDMGHSSNIAQHNLEVQFPL